MPRTEDTGFYAFHTFGVVLRRDVSLPLARRMLNRCIDSPADGMPDPCWIWQGYTDKDGYAEIKHKGRKHRAARLSYALFIGDIDEGNDIDHVCRRRGCINPKQRNPMINRVILRDARKNARGV